MTHKIFTGLNDKGRAAMTEFLRANLKDQSLLDRQQHFEDDVDFDRNPGAYELAGRFTKTGNPVTTTFAEDEMLTEEVED